MKNNYISFLLLFFGLSTTAQIINIPDTNFKNVLINTNCAYLLSGTSITDVDTNDDGEIEVSEAQDVQWLTLNANNIVNLFGLDYFNNLENLSIYGNPIISIDLSLLSHLTNFSVSYSSLTEINLCGTAVTWLWCQDNPYLQALYLKNGVVSSDLAKNSTQIPPPLHNFEFYNTPALNYICYDDGELDAVMYGIGGNTTGKTLTTSCDASCSLSVGSPIVNNTISFYPNPTSGIVNIMISDNQSINRTSVTNVLGQTILTFENVTTLDVSSLTKGTYFVTVETDAGRATQKIIKL